MRIATWNIAGGHTIASLNRFDYEARNLDYFAEHLTTLNLDVICVQESQMKGGYSVAKELAQKIGMGFVFETPMSVSHIEEGYKLSSAIISRKPLTSRQAIKLPYPSFPLYLPDGREALHHDKYLQIAKVDGIRIANTTNQPLEYLGHPYTDRYGQEYAKEITEAMIKSLQVPLVLAGDFNTPDPQAVFKEMCSLLRLADVLPPEPTKPHGDVHTDCILTSPEFMCKQSSIEQTATDHFLCWAELGRSV